MSPTAVHSVASVDEVSWTAAHTIQSTFIQFSSRWHLCTWQKPTWNLPHIAIMSSPLKHFPNVVFKTCQCWSDFMVALLHPLINGALVHINTVVYTAKWLGAEPVHVLYIPLTHRLKVAGHTDCRSLFFFFSSPWLRPVVHSQLHHDK